MFDLANIPWNGLLVDDPGHPLDIEARVQQVLDVLWPVRREALEHEACEMLSVKTLRESFRKSQLFFADHLKRYSKSRRQAPIYWPLASSNAGYTIWCYYHRFRRDTLSLALGDFANPKLRHEQKQLDDLRAEAGPQPTRNQREEIEAQETLVSELSGFVEELARVAPLWNPDLNDGVIINYAPLWRLIGHTPWRKAVKECWDTLCAGDYDWAHLAMHLWPERVVPKCADDRSLAIAHGLEAPLWVEDNDKWRKLHKPADEIADQKQRRQLEKHDRLRDSLQTLANSPKGSQASADIWQMLERGQLDETPLALLLRPRQVIDNLLLKPDVAKQLGVQLPATLTKQAVKSLIERHDRHGCADLVPLLQEAFQGAASWASQWQCLAAGDADNLPLTLLLWPNRVVETCLASRELCDTHTLTRFFWYEDPVTGWRRRATPTEEVELEVTRRRNPTVKAALDSLMTAPPLIGVSGGRRGSRSVASPRRTRAASSEVATNDTPVTRSRPRASTPTTDVETLEAVRNVIAAVPGGASKTDVLTATGLSEARWTAAITALLEQGTVTKTGERRATRYHLAEEIEQTASSISGGIDTEESS